MTSPRKHWLPNNRAVVMGILNVTPDSFTDGGAYFDRTAAVARGLEMEREGAEIIDIGGESTRPGADPVPAEEELARVIPVIETLRRKSLRIPISIDTYKASVADHAMRAGAQVINDISGLRFDPLMPAVARKHRAGLILMHIRGTPKIMQSLPPVQDVVSTVRKGLRWSIDLALAAGIRKDQIVVDPGIGFSKTVEQNFALITALPRLAKLGYPLLVGPSRKSFIRRTIEGRTGRTYNRPAQREASPQEVLCGTAAVVSECVMKGARIVRVHDVRAMAAVVALANRMLLEGSP
jgi:dihydropteroate synthase